jgi:hypothetical protein
MDLKNPKPITLHRDYLMEHFILFLKYVYIFLPPLVEKNHMINQQFIEWLSSTKSFRKIDERDIEK